MPRLLSNSTTSTLPNATNTCCHEIREDSVDLEEIQGKLALTPLSCNLQSHSSVMHTLHHWTEKANELQVFASVQYHW